MARENSTTMGNNNKNIKDNNIKDDNRNSNIKDNNGNKHFSWSQVCNKVKTRSTAGKALYVLSLSAFNSDNNGLKLQFGHILMIPANLTGLAEAHKKYKKWKKRKNQTALSSSQRTVEQKSLSSSSPIALPNLICKGSDEQQIQQEDTDLLDDMLSCYCPCYCSFVLLLHHFDS